MHEYDTWYEVQECMPGVGWVVTEDGEAYDTREQAQGALGWWVDSRPDLKFRIHKGRGQA